MSSHQSSVAANASNPNASQYNQSTYNNGAHNAASVDKHHSAGHHVTNNGHNVHKHHNPLKSIGARLITGYLLLVWFIWFLVEISIHSASISPSVTAWRSLMTGSFVAYGIQGLVMAGSLAALWYSEAIRTRSTQLMAFIVATFVVFTWFLDISFVRNNLTDNDIRGYCGNTIRDSFVSATSTNFSNSSQLCRLSRAAAVLSVLMELGQFALHLYCLARLVMPLTDPTVTEEQLLVTEACQQAVNRGHVLKVNSLNRTIIALVLLSLAGYIIFTLSWIKVQTWQRPATYTGAVGDPLLNQMSYQLSLLWIIALASSTLAAGRHSRGVTALAFCFTAASTLALWSFYIFSARRIRQWNGPLTQVNFSHAERAVVAGLGIMLVGETIRAATLLVRYYNYIPVMLAPEALGVNGQRLAASGHNHWPTANKNNYNHSDKAAHSARAAAARTVNPATAGAGTAQYPTEANLNGTGVAPHHSTTGHHATGKATGTGADGLPTTVRAIPADFVMPVFANASTLLKAIVAIHVLVTLAWFFAQMVLECHIGLFNDIAKTGTRIPFAALYNDPERTFIYHLLIGAAAISVCYFSERIPLHCTAVGAATSLLVLIGAWFLLEWPFHYNSIYNNGTSQKVLLDKVRVNITNDYSRGAKAVAVFGFLQLLALTVMFFYALTRAAARITVVTKQTLLLFAALTAFATFLWGLTWIAPGMRYAGYNAPYTGGSNNEGYIYASAFFLLVSLAASVWANSVVSTSDLSNTSRGWKELCWLLSFVTFTFMLPIFIAACRFIHQGWWNHGLDAVQERQLGNTSNTANFLVKGNSSAVKALCAGLIILGIGVFAKMLAVFLLISTPRLVPGHTARNADGTLRHQVIGGKTAPGINQTHHMSGDPKAVAGKGMNERDLEAGTNALSQAAAPGMIKDVGNSGNQNYIMTSTAAVVAPSTTVSPGHHLAASNNPLETESRRHSNDASSAGAVDFHNNANVPPHAAQSGVVV